MRSPFGLARRSQALRAADFSNLCWTCLIAQRRQLSHATLHPRSLPRSSYSSRAARYAFASTSSKTPKEAAEAQSPNATPPRGPPTKGHPTIEDYHRDGDRLLAQLIDRHRRQASQQQDAIDYAKSSKPQDASASKQSFHTSSRPRQQATAIPIITPQQAAAKTFQKSPVLTTIDYLRRWQEQFGCPNQELLDELGIEAYGGLSENLSRLGVPDDLRDIKVPVEDDENHSTAAFLDPEDTMEQENRNRQLKIGDLVEIIFQGEREPLIAVFIAQYGQQGQFYNVQGKWFHRKVKEIMFAVPRFIDPAILQPILPYLPKGEVSQELLDSMHTMDVNAPRQIAAPVLKQLQAFSEEADAAYRRNASVLDQAHQMLAHPQNLKFSTLQRISEALLQTKNVPIPTMYAVRKSLLRQPLGFHVDSRSHRQTGVFQIMPIEFKEGIELAMSWIREFQDEVAGRVVEHTKPPRKTTSKKVSKLPQTNKLPHVESEGAANVRKFIQKCRKLIDQSRTMRDFTPHGRIGISKVRNEISPSTTAMQDFHSLEFTESDTILIRFMEAWSISIVFHHNTRMGALPPVVLRAMDRYPDVELSYHTGFVFLQEIGVIPPHENRAKFNPHLLLPTASHSRQLEQMYTAIVKMGSNRNTAKLTDSMAHLRKDWGSLPVYCIDSDSAEEIDDGVSFERIPGSSDCWAHVHIANPTAFLPKYHLIAKMAAHLTESIYMPERTYSMLPKWVSDELLSLGADRPCLTISIRLNEKGEVVDHTIQSGMMRKYVPLTPQTLQEVVDESGAKAAAARPDITLTVGGKVPTLPRRKMTKAHELTDDQKADLRGLHKLAIARQQRRTEAGGIFWNQNYPDMTVYDSHSSPGLPWSHPSRKIARYTEGDPVIKLEATPTESWFQPAGTGTDLMVREMMLLAGEVGALWCKERQIPAIFRGTIANGDMLSIEEYREKYIKPTLDENGNPPVKIAFNYLPHAGASVTSLTPLPHQVLGVKQYVKLTSPLRRYGDMLMHWQIESALRKEAELGHSLAESPLVPMQEGKSKYNRFWEFTANEVQSITTRLAPRERLITKTKRGSQAFWLSQLFFRAFYYGEATLPETINVVVFSNARELGRVAVLWPEFSFDLDMAFPDELGFDHAEIGDRWEVRIVEVDTYIRRVKTVPVRLISREVLPDWVDL